MPGVTPQVVKFEQLRTFKFSIPKLQRNYVWDDDDIDGVIQAINELDNEESKFLGSLIHWESEENKFDIIDGQQRTATFTMFAKAAVDAYSIWSELNQDAALQIR